MKIGDKVSVLDEDITGIITSIENNTIVVLTEDDFEVQYARNELVIMNMTISEKEFISQPLSKIISEKEPRKVKKKPMLGSKKIKIPPMEIDLHIHQIVPNCSRLSSHEKLTIQLETVKNRLEFAFRKKIQRIVFIHGVGEGVLREEMHYLLKRYDNIDFYDADFQKYGVGATEVYVFQNKNS